MSRCQMCDWSDTASSLYRAGLQVKLNAEQVKYIMFMPDGVEICSYCHQNNLELKKHYDKLDRKKEEEKIGKLPEE